MANHKSALTRIRRNARRTVINNDRRMRIRSFIKKVESAIAKGDKPVAQAALAEAMPEMARGVGAGVLHRNTVARKLSRLSARVKAMA